MHLYTQYTYVCDFDAAVELGEDDEMLPNSQVILIGLATSREGETITVQASF